jgi:hypothetical protein
LNRLVYFHETGYGGPIQWDIQEVIFNPIASTILKWFRFKFQIFSRAHSRFGIGNQGMYFTKGSEMILNQIKYLERNENILIK